MKREILFRGKRLDNNKWIYGFYFKCKPNIHSEVKYYIQPIRKNGMAGILREVDPSTVSQFTGETDKSGAKIFEGDKVIMRGYNGKHIATVYFKDGKFAVDGSHYGFKDLKSRTYTKIGTIYDKENKDDISLNCTKPKCDDRAK